MAFLFTFRFWHIKNYTHRVELDRWLHKYSTGLWWVVGGYNIFKSIVQGCLVLGGTVFFIFALSKQFTVKGMPEHEMIGAMMVIAMIIIVIIVLIGKHLNLNRDINQYSVISCRF
jgi:hypothetical protein